MPKLSKSYIKNRSLMEKPRFDDLNRMLESPNPYPNGLPPLRESCWYVGRIGNFTRDGRPIVYNGISHPTVALMCCDGVDIVKGDWVIYELSYIKGFHAGGIFKEMFRREFRKPV